MKIIKQRFALILVSATILLLIPAIAMFFTSEVKWTSFDFLVAAILLYGSGTACELVIRKFKSIKSRLICCGIVLLLLMLIWIELAVGIFGTPFAGN